MYLIVCVFIYLLVVKYTTFNTSCQEIKHISLFIFMRDKPFPENLVKLCEKYGITPGSYGWKPTLAKILKVEETTISAWVERDIPHWVRGQFLSKTSGFHENKQPDEKSNSPGETVPRDDFLKLQGRYEEIKENFNTLVAGLSAEIKTANKNSADIIAALKKSEVHSQ